MVALKDRRVALIGGAGFIGHHLALALAERGAQVSIVDSFFVNNLVQFIARPDFARHRDLYVRMILERLDLLRQAGVALHVQDARDYHKLSQTLDEISPHVIVHLAAVAHAGRSNKDPYSTFDHSLRTLENALDFAKGLVEHFIYFSSSMVYGNFDTQEVTEDTVCEPLGIYGALKFAGEKIVIAYNQVFGLPYTIVRPSALYGARCVSRRVGQAFIENLMQGQKLTVSGDGSERLDFTYVGDLVDGIAKVIEHEEARNQVFNLTYGRSRSIEELTRVLAGHFPDIAIEYQPRDSLMPERGTLSIEKARSLLGYSPAYPLERGIAEYVAWYRSFWHAGGS